MEENQQQDSNQAPTNPLPVNNTPPAGVNMVVSTGDGPNGPFPQELNKWNWGAFLLSWIWSIGNNVWIGLLVLLSFIPVLGPIISLVMIIMLGKKGNEWAWKAKKWDSIEHFKMVQAKWRKWGIILTVGSIVIALLVGILFAVMIVSVSKNAPTAVNGQYGGSQATTNSTKY